MVLPLTVPVAPPRVYPAFMSPRRTSVETVSVPVLSAVKLKKSWSLSLPITPDTLRVPAAMFPSENAAPVELPYSSVGIRASSARSTFSRR